MQEHIAKTDFLKLIQATIDKIHDVTDLTESEKMDLKEKIYLRRTDFGDRVLTWIDSVRNNSEEIKDDFDTLMNQYYDLFVDEMSTNPEPGTANGVPQKLGEAPTGSTPASLINNYVAI